MRALVLVGVAACGATPVATPPIKPVAIVIDAGAAAAPLTGPPVALVPAAAKRRMIEAPHGAEIRLLALTPDGKTALSVDELSGARLWPLLDGTLEPRLVDLPEVKRIALARKGDGFMVTGIDDAGNLVFVEIDASGLERGHATVDGDPAFVGLEMTDLGALAWRSDQTVALYGADGAQLGKIGTDAGQQLAALATRGRHAIALVDTLVADKVEKRARELVLEPKLAWGRTFDAAKLAEGPIAIAPNGKRFAFVGPVAGAQPIHTIVIDMASGKAIGDENAGAQSTLGFVDDNHLAIAAPGGVSWLDLTDPKPTYYPSEPTFSGPPVLAVGDGRAVTKNSGELVLQTPVENRFLGYGIPAPTVAAAGPDGKLVIGFGEAFTTLTGDLRMEKDGTAPKLPQGVNVYALRYLGNADWAAEISQVSDGQTSVVMVSTDATAPQTIHAGLRVIQPMMYEPSTHLLTLSLGEAPEILRYDATKRRVDRVVALPKPKGFEQFELVPVAPKLANGATILKIAIRDHTTVEWMTDDKATARAASATIDAFAGADASGRVFAWNNHPGGELALEIYANGARAGTLAHDGPVGLWPDPGATRVLETAAHSTSLYTADKLTWTHELAGVNEALWLSDGAIAIITASGIARLDPKTGSVQAARCGWKFGLSPKPHPPASRVEPVCAQLDR